MTETHAHRTPPFTAESTAAEVIDGIDLTGRRAIVTGGASGIGVETARALAGAGAEVTLAVRNLEAGERTAEDIIATTGNKQVLVAPLDLADQASVAAFVAGVGRPAAHPGQQRRRDGRARDAHAGGLGAAVRHQPPRPLRPRHRPAPGARGGRRRPHRLGQLERAPALAGRLRRHPLPSTATYEPWAAYGQSKTANVLFAVEATRRWAGDGITVNALMPGGDPDQPAAVRRPTRSSTGCAPAPAARGVRWKTPEQGAATSVLVATSPLLDGVGGRYFEDCNEAEPNQPGSRRGVAAYALDPDAAARLWQVSVDLLAQ